MLVPMYPMDAGRVLHAILWRSSSYNAAMKITTTVGLVSRGRAWSVIAIVFDEMTSCSRSRLFGGVTCWMEKRRLAFEGEFEFGYDFSRGYQGLLTGR